MGRVVLRLIVIALGLSFTWEMLQMSAFAGLPESRLIAAGVCALAAVGDALIALAVFGLGVIVLRDRRWFAPPNARRYALVVAAGLLLQLAIEWIAVHRLALWSYRDRHPIIPGLDVGVWPTLQPIVVLPLTFWLLGKSREVRA